MTSSEIYRSCGGWSVGHCPDPGSTPWLGEVDRGRILAGSLAYYPHLQRCEELE